MCIRDSLADLLQAVVLERDLVVEAVLRAAGAARQLGDEEAHVGVELLEVAVAVGDDLREEGVQVAEGDEPAAELLALLGAVVGRAALGEPLHGLVEPGVSSWRDRRASACSWGGRTRCRSPRPRRGSRSAPR